MKYFVSDITAEVRVALDQNQAENAIIAMDDNTLELDDVIRQKLLHAARALLEESDVSVIDCGTALSGEPTEVEGKGYGELAVWRLSLPADYLRLLSLQMSDWRRAVHVTIPEESAAYDELQSGFVGIGGNPDRPAVAEVLDSNSGRALEIYTSVEGELKKGRYCPIPKIIPSDEGSYVLFPERLYRHLIYQTAALVASAYGEVQLSQLLMNMVNDGEAAGQPAAEE